MTPVQKLAGVLMLATMVSAVRAVHAGRGAHVDPAHAQRIIAITDSGDQGLIALRACQAYVRKVSGGENERATH